MCQEFKKFFRNLQLLQTFYRRTRKESKGFKGALWKEQSKTNMKERLRQSICENEGYPDANELRIILRKIG